jgi:AraC-like DNA-binding protein
MPELSYSSQSLPTPQEFRKVLREAAEQYDPLEELLRLQLELTALEQRLGMSSEECYRLFYEGKMGDTPEIFGWVSRYRGFRELKAAIAEALKAANTEPQAA